MCEAELASLPEGVQRVARALQEKGHPQDLLRLTGAPVADIVQAPAA